MKGFSALVVLVVVLQGCASSRAAEFIYFPQLARSVLSGDDDAFGEVLFKAETTLPGEQLEELAVISSRFVRLEPAQFLRVQSAHQHCFGVGFMGAAYVDNQAMKQREIVLRRKALESVSDSSLASIKARCLAELDGS